MFFLLILSFIPQVEILEYKLYWAGIEAGSLTLKYEEFEETIEINMKSYTTGIARKFYYMEDEATSIVRKKDFQTLFYHKKIKEKKKEKEETSIFLPEEKTYFFKYFRYYNFFSIDILSIFYFLRSEKKIESPLKVYENGKFYEIFIEEEKNHIFNYKGKNFETRKITLLRKDKKNANIVIYLLEKENNYPISIEFSIPIGKLKAILQCY